MRNARAFFLGVFSAALFAGAAAAGNYEFLAPPQTDFNLVYRLDKATGEVGACQFGLKKDAAIGVTLCYPSGEGAKAGANSDYALVASHHSGESGVFRVDLRSGMMSSCYVLFVENKQSVNEGSVVCTPPAK